jgi:predicted RNA binding protein YcfA (HicA-like mRNA interferase family)
MSKLPVLKPREVVRILEKLGFKLIRERGSHKQFKHADGRQTTVAFHKSCDISPIMLKVIAADIGMTAEGFIRYR